MQWALLVRLASRAHQVLLAKTDLLGLQAPLDHQDCKAHLEVKEHLVNEAYLVQLDLKELRARQVNRDKWDYPEPRFT